MLNPSALFSHVNGRIMLKSYKCPVELSRDEQRRSKPSSVQCKKTSVDDDDHDDQSGIQAEDNLFEIFAKIFPDFCAHWVWIQVINKCWFFGLLNEYNRLLVPFNSWMIRSHNCKIKQQIHILAAIYPQRPCLLPVPGRKSSSLSFFRLVFFYVILLS